MVKENYEPKTKFASEDKKQVVSSLKKIIYDLLDYYLDRNKFNELQNKYRRKDIGRVIKKYSNSKRQQFNP